MTQGKSKTGNLITPEAILSFPAVFTPQPPMNPGEKPKYGCTLVFTPEAQKTPRFKALQQEALRVARVKFGAEADGLIRAGKLNFPFLKDEDAGYPPGSVFIRPRSESKPGIVGCTPDASGRAALITDPNEIYPGIVVLASVSCYAYDKKMNRGVTFGLGNIQKLRDGDRLDNRKHAQDEFTPVEAVEESDLADLIGPA